MKKKKKSHKSNPQRNSQIKPQPNPQSKQKNQTTTKPTIHHRHTKPRTHKQNPLFTTTSTTTEATATNKIHKTHSPTKPSSDLFNWSSFSKSQAFSVLCKPSRPRRGFVRAHLDNLDPYRSWCEDEKEMHKRK
jgi:hypothetical protein